jgi:hypothetical protein
VEWGCIGREISKERKERKEGGGKRRRERYVGVRMGCTV